MIDIREHGGSFNDSKGGGDIEGNNSNNLTPIDFGAYPIIENISSTNLKKGDKVGFYLKLEKLPLPPSGVGGFSFDGKYCVSQSGDFYRFDNGIYTKLSRSLTSSYTPSNVVYSASFSRDNQYAVVTFASRTGNYTNTERFVFKRNTSDDSFQEIYSDKGYTYGSFVNSEKYKHLYFDNSSFLIISGSSVSKETYDSRNLQSNRNFSFANVDGYNLAYEVMSDGKDEYAFHKINRSGTKDKEKVTINLRNRTVSADAPGSASLFSNIFGNAYAYLSGGYEVNDDQKKDPNSYTMRDFFDVTHLRDSDSVIEASDGYNTSDFQVGLTAEAGGFALKHIKNKKIPFVRYHKRGNDSDTFSYYALLFGNTSKNIQVARIWERNLGVKLPKGMESDGYYGMDPNEGYAHVMKVRPLKDYLDPKNYGAPPQFVIELKVDVPSRKKLYN